MNNRIHASVLACISCLCLFLSVSPTSAAPGTADQGWKEDTWYGVKEEIRSRDNCGKTFECYPPCDKICVIVRYLDGPKSLGGSGGPGSRGPAQGQNVGIWIPSSNEGYVNATYQGSILGPNGGSVQVYMSETSSTRAVSSYDEMVANMGK